MNDELNFQAVFGAAFSDPDLRDYKIAKTSLQTEFPESFALDMPPVKNQGSVSSCVAHAITLVAEYFANVQHDMSDTQLSVGYIYGNRTLLTGTSEGMCTRFAIANFCADGTPLLTDFPLHCEVPEIIDAVKAKKEELHEIATQFRFTSYLKATSEQEIKTALMNGSPLVIAVNWQKDMKVVNGIMTSEWKEKTGGHAMVLYGWTPEGWLIQNSWGEKWGTNGTVIWPYDYPIRESYVIIDTEDTPLEIKKPYKAKTKFGKWLVRVLNKVYCWGYKLYYFWTKQ